VTDLLAERIRVARYAATQLLGLRMARGRSEMLPLGTEMVVRPAAPWIGPGGTPPPPVAAPLGINGDATASLVFALVGVVVAALA
jgi:hypothetical protein